MERISGLKKSKQDKRKYRYIELSNAIRCILVSADDLEQSAASLDVKIGSLHEPRQFPGLAHFCEHMLLLSTEKYPDKNSYSTFIANHGGTNNAFTDNLDTNYYFSVSNAAFSEALDRFSQFFKAPLFNSDSISKEINAVDSEHKRNLCDDDWRFSQLVYFLAQPESCISLFHAGSAETLRKKQIRDELISFYNGNYSANLMTLSLIGKHSLDQLEELCQRNFASIENKRVAPLNTAVPVAYDKPRLGKLLKVVPVAEKQELVMMWKFPDTRMNYKTKPGHYLAHMLSHEGENSLLSYLVDEGLTVTLSSFIDPKEANTSFLTLLMNLTEKGVKEYERVIEIVAQYTKMLQAKGPQKYFFDEIAKYERLNFDYKDYDNVLDIAHTLSRAIQDYNKDNIRDVLEGTNVVTEYDKKAIQELLDLMNHENMIIALISKECKDYADKEEVWYKTLYSCEDFKESLKKALSEPKIGPSINGKVLALPQPNTLFPKNINLISKPKNSVAYPKIIKTASGSNLWYKYDHKFCVPKVYGYCSIHTSANDFSVSPESHVFIKLYLDIFFEEIREFIYTAKMAGNTCKFEIQHNKLTLNFCGFNESLPLLIHFLFKKWKEFQIVKAMFDIKLNDNLNNTKSDLKKTPYRFARSNYLAGLTNYTIDCHQQLKALKNFTFEKFQQYAKNLLHDLRFEWYIAGNILEEDAILLASEGEKHLLEASAIENVPLSYKTIKIPDQTEYLLCKRTPNSSELNSCIVSYFQGKPYLNSELDQWAMNEVAIDFIKESAYDYLRVKLQLGYLVDLQTENINETLGARFLIQSDKACPEKLYQKINDFLSKSWEKIKNLTDAEFKTHVEAVRVPLKQNYISLKEETDNYWKEITTGTHLFDRKKRVVKILKNLKKEAVINYFSDMFFNNTRRYDYELVCANHWKENCMIKRENVEFSQKRGNTRIEVDNIQNMKEFNSIRPDIKLLERQSGEVLDKTLKN